MRGYHCTNRVHCIERLFRDTASLNNTPQRAQWQLFPFVVGDNHLLPSIWVTPFLVATTLRD